MATKKRVRRKKVASRAPDTQETVEPVLAPSEPEFEEVEVAAGGEPSADAPGPQVPVTPRPVQPARPARGQVGGTESVSDVDHYVVEEAPPEVIIIQGKAYPLHQLLKLVAVYQMRRLKILDAM